MKNSMKKIVVLTSGGDAPGMNAAVRAVVRYGIAAGIDLYASENGYAGLVHKKLKHLHPESVANCIQRGGTILKTKRIPEFADKAVRDECRAFLAEQNIDGVIVLGGNGSFTGAKLLNDEGGPNVVGIPCTIDNDISNTDYSIGFDTACNTAISAIDRIRDTALSLDRNFMIEVMGRCSGFIAVEVGIAAGAEYILIPEFKVDIEELCSRIKNGKRKKLTSIIVTAEANHPGQSFDIADSILQKTGIDYHVCVLGHIQRGGMPTMKDRVTGTLMGAKAIEALMAGEKGVMTAVKQGTITTAPFAKANESTRYFSNKHDLNINRIICQS